MALNWQSLRPHIPLSPGSPEYVEPPTSGRRDIAGWVLAGGNTVLLGGPTGVGKSTELAQAAEQMQQERVVCLAPLDRWENMRSLTVDRMLLRLAGRLVDVAVGQLGLDLSPDLRVFLWDQGVLNDERSMIGGMAARMSPRAALLDAIHQVESMARQRRVTLAIDGLEKIPPGSECDALFGELGMLPDNVDIVVVVPWHLTFGAQPEAMVRPGETFVPIRALDLDGQDRKTGFGFMIDLLTRRLGINAESLDPAAVARTVSGDAPQKDIIASRRWVVQHAAGLSGGIPRFFLQLMADAATYARLRSGLDWPEKQDLAAAQADQEDSFRRLLLPGDTEAVRKNRGKDGRELDLERKIRLMAHGVLLERLRRNRPILDVHPLADSVFQGGGW